MSKPALFLDRDGVLNQRIMGDYIKHIDQWQWEEQVLTALQLAVQYFSPIIIVTNQQGIGKQMMTEDALSQIHQQMLTEIRANGGHIDAVYHCPHLATQHCGCRKPEIGMLQQAQNDFSNIDLHSAFMVGDAVSDIEMAQRAGIQAVFVTNRQDIPADLPNPEKTLIFPKLIDFVRYFQTLALSNNIEHLIQ